MGRGEINSEGRKLVGGYEGGDIVGERGGLHLRGKRCNWGETWETAAPASEISVVHQKVLHCSASQSPCNDIFAPPGGQYLGFICST